jgi:SagB-type dehydrogenase family enzyme
MGTGARKTRAGLYRRSPHLVCYWVQGQFVFENYITRSRVSALPLTAEVLHFFESWRSVSQLLRRFPGFAPASLERAVRALARANLLERSDRSNRSRPDPLRTWKNWAPAASFLHFSTKDSHAPVEPEDSLRELRRLARTKPMPPSVKAYPGARQFLLPPPQSAGEFAGVLLARRTWRAFSRAPIELRELATLLGLSFGVQSWMRVPGIGSVALKTSPSGGARHAIESYVLALRVKGLPPGLYHYAAGTHKLELLRRGATPSEVARCLNGQWWFAGASAVIFMTAVFARTQWKYPAPRAYRIVLIDAGHICQTFCLVATWVGLAPFCTMALTDSRIEAALRIDGIKESVLYAAGVGMPPDGAKSSPWPGRVSQGTARANRSFATVDKMAKNR